MMNVINVIYAIDYYEYYQFYFFLFINISDYRVEGVTTHWSIEEREFNWVDKITK